MLDTESFGTTFGPKSQRKKPRIVASDVEVSYYCVGVIGVTSVLYFFKSLAKSVEECAGKVCCAHHIAVCTYMI